jgi:hypothetical protein
MLTVAALLLLPLLPFLDFAATAAEVPDTTVNTCKQWEVTDAATPTKLVSKTLGRFGWP